MTKTSRVLAITTVLLIAARSEARAQSSQAPAILAFVIAASVRKRRPAASTRQTFPVFGETATISSSQLIHNGAFFDINGGYRVWRGPRWLWVLELQQGSGRRGRRRDSQPTDLRSFR